MLTGIIIGYIAGLVVGIIAAAFLAAGRDPRSLQPDEAPGGPRRSRATRFVLSKRGGLGRRVSGRSRVVA